MDSLPESERGDITYALVWFSVGILCTLAFCALLALMTMVGR